MARYRLIIQFAKPADSENWETVAAPVFNTSADEEEVYARVRNTIAGFPADLPGTGERDEQPGAGPR